MVRWLVRLEGLVIGLAALLAYFVLGGSWWMFLLLILVPDISMVGYLINPKIGSYIYNSAHTYLVPMALLLIGWWLQIEIVELVSLVWICHIGFDRLFGFGLKYPTNFKDTHLQKI